MSSVFLSKSYGTYWNGSTGRSREIKQAMTYIHVGLNHIIDEGVGEAFKALLDVNSALWLDNVILQAVFRVLHISL
jgi:hypothetical protein